MVYRNIFLLLLIIISSFTVIAQPPGQTLGVLQMLYPKVEFVTFGEDLNLHIVGVDSLGFILDNIEFDCGIHVYNSQNIHIVEDVMKDDSNGVDKEYILNNSVLSEVGDYSYNIFCNSSTESGAVSEFFTVSRTGDDPKSNSVGMNNLLLVFGFGFIALILFLVGSGFKEERFNVLKIVFYWVAILHVMIIALILSYTGNCTGGQCYDITKYQEMLFGYGISMVLFTLYSLYMYTAKKLQKTQEDWWSGTK